jgi:hypothetical protein
VSPLAQLAPPANLRAYIVHRLTDDTTVPVHATGPTAAIEASRLGSGWVHDAKTSHCDSCIRAQAAEAVTPC